MVEYLTNLRKPTGKVILVGVYGNPSRLGYVSGGIKKDEVEINISNHNIGISFDIRFKKLIFCSNFKIEDIGMHLDELVGRCDKYHVDVKGIYDDLPSAMERVFREYFLLFYKTKEIEKSLGRLEQAYFRGNTLSELRDIEEQIRGLAVKEPKYELFEEDLIGSLRKSIDRAVRKEAFEVAAKLKFRRDQLNAKKEIIRRFGRENFSKLFYLDYLFN